ERPDVGLESRRGIRRRLLRRAGGSGEQAGKEDGTGGQTRHGRDPRSGGFAGGGGRGGSGETLLLSADSGERARIINARGEAGQRQAVSLSLHTNQSWLSIVVALGSRAHHRLSH